MKLTTRKLKNILKKEQEKIDESFVDPSSKNNIKIALNNMAVEIKKVLEKVNQNETRKK